MFQGHFDLDDQGQGQGLNLLKTFLLQIHG